MASTVRAEYNKEQIFLEYFFLKNPKYKNYTEEEKNAVREEARCGAINVEIMMEQLLSILQPALKNVCADGMDYTSDIPQLHEADCKTISVNRLIHKKRGKEHVVYRGQINRADKKGPLLISVYNAYKKNIDFFYIPLEHYKGPKKIMIDDYNRIQFTYSTKNDIYNTLEPYRVSSIEEMLLLVKPAKKPKKKYDNALEKYIYEYARIELIQELKKTRLAT
jgi:hypothetical protein